MYNTSLFIFRRDLRIYDNTALNQALQQSKQIIPLFILDPRQIGAKNTYRSERAVQFMFESLKDLDAQLKKHNAQLFLGHDIAEHLIEKLILKESIDAVFSNYDYTPFAQHRDNLIKTACKQQNIPFYQYHDTLLHEPGSVLTAAGSPYTKFTPFYKKAAIEEIAAPTTHPHPNYASSKSKILHDVSLLDHVMPDKHTPLITPGGRTAAHKLLQNLSKITNYLKLRDIPAANHTSHLSAHLKFGTYSARELYATITNSLKNPEPLIRQLYWRDFFTTISFFFPQVFGASFQKKFQSVTWSYDEQAFQRWCTGTTGFPIVDAGMRQLNETGYMHNRARLITASFLTKDLHIDWQWGERYFAQQLIDYDPAVNNGNWQWIAGTGCDAQPYFRIFNPWLQQKRFDPQCNYIKEWLPELRNISTQRIHNWYKETSRDTTIPYPVPMIEHDKESRISKNLFSQKKSPTH